MNASPMTAGSYFGGTVWDDSSMPVGGMPGGGMSGAVIPGVMPAQPTPTGGKNSKQPQQPLSPPGSKTPSVAGPMGLLISQGIVPGVSTVTSGGVVVAAGVTTPAGRMTPAGVQLPNGTLNNQVVLRACALHPNCNAGRPCGMSPGCGNVVPVAMVSNNAVALASSLASNMPGGVVQSGGMPIPVGGRVNGMLVNPISGQPVYGMSMNGSPQIGYPPIGYTPSGYSPKYPRFDGLGLGGAAADMAPYLQQLQQQQLQQQQEEEGEDEEDVPGPQSAMSKSQMPVPRFHPVPSKPAFQRSGGLPVVPKTATGGQKVSSTHRSTNRRASAAMDWNDMEGEVYDTVNGEDYSDGNQQLFSKKSINSAMKRAYLEGMNAAMEEVEAELDAEHRSELSEDARMQAKVLNQAKKLQTKIESRKRASVTQDEVDEDAIEEHAVANRHTEAEQRRLNAIEKQSRLQARREAELKAREEALLQAEIAQVRLEREQLHRAQIQQAQLLQVQLDIDSQNAERFSQPLRQQQPPRPPVRQTEQGSQGRGLLASAVSLLKGSEPPPVSQQSKSMPTNPKTLQKTAGGNSNQMLPLNEWLGLGTKSQGQTGQNAKNMKHMQQNSPNAQYAACQSGKTYNTQAVASLQRKQTLDKPERPPTGCRPSAKAQRMIEVEDGWESDLEIQQANYIGEN